MARYFNKTRGPLTVSLRTGEPALVGPKKYLVVTPEQDRSPSILSRVRKGLLVPVKEKAPKPVPAGATKADAPTPEPPPIEEVEEVPSKGWTKGRLTEHAESMGLEVPSSWTKVEILEAIEEAGR